MKRKFLNAILLLAACGALAACDKCGGIQDINVPGHATKVCADDSTRK